MSKIASYKFVYPLSHWARKVQMDFLIKRYDSPLLDDGTYMIHYLNPSDRNGYRSILKFFNDDQSKLEKLWNRQASIEEYNALYSVIPEICMSYVKLGLFPQVFMLGNNSHNFFEGKMILGCDNEPCFAHVHIYGRGDPTYQYVHGIPLGGVVPGKDVNLRDKSTYSNMEEAQKLIKSLL